MITLQKINGRDFVLNADLIETLEATPDTVIKLTNGKMLISKNSIEDIIEKVIKYKQLCHQTLPVVRSEEKNKEFNIE